MSSCLSAVIVGATRQQLRRFGPAIERAGYRLAIVQTLEDIPTLHDLHQIALLVYTSTVDHEEVVSVCQIFQRQPDLLILHDDLAQPNMGFAPYQRDTYDSEMIEHILSNRIRHHQKEPTEPTPALDVVIAATTNPVQDKDIARPLPDTIESATSNTAIRDEKITHPTTDAVESRETDDESPQTPDTDDNMLTSAVIPEDEHEEEVKETLPGEQPVSLGNEQAFSPYGIPTPTTSADQTPYHISAGETFSEHRPQQPQPVAQPTYPVRRSGKIIALIPIIGILVIASIIGLVVGYRQFVKPEPAHTTDTTVQATTPQETNLETDGTHHASSTDAQSDAGMTAPNIDLTAEIVGIYPNEITVGEVINIRIRIQNRGTHNITEPFWVDLYVSPHQQPNVNDSWNTLCSYGATWLVEELGASETLILETLDADTSRSNLLRFSTPGPQTVQVLVDSYGKETIGAIAEQHEDNNLSDKIEIHIASGDTPEAENTF